MYGIVAYHSHVKRPLHRNRFHTVPSSAALLILMSSSLRPGYLLCLFLLSFCIVQIPARAQMHIQNMAEHDQKPYYFGLTFGLNFSTYRIRYDNSFATTDTFKKIEPYWSPGFNLGLMGNLRVSRRIDLRFIPSLSFSEKRLQYDAPQTDSIIDKSIEAILVHLPVQLKFKSDRLRNFRFYAMTGGKFDYDLSANARSRRNDEFLKVRPIDLGVELGAGFEFYYPNFIFSPEIKISQGFLNQVYHDPNIPLSNAIQGINTRMIVISIHLEG